MASNRCPSPPRAVLGSGVFAEGWAVYVTQVTIDAERMRPMVVGALGDTPGFVHLEHLETVLRHGSPPIPQLRRLVLGEAR